MAKNIQGSQVADRGSKIENSKNNSHVSIGRIRTESAIISFIVGVVTSLVASYLYDVLK